MKPILMKWMMAVTLGLSLTAAGCGDKGESGTPPPPPPAGLAPATPAERTGPEGMLPGSDQSPAGINNERSPEDEGKSQRR